LENYSFHALKGLHGAEGEYRNLVGIYVGTGGARERIESRDIRWKGERKG